VFSLRGRFGLSGVFPLTIPAHRPGLPSGGPPTAGQRAISSDLLQEVIKVVGRRRQLGLLSFRYQEEP
jgi:hypothetical protein